MASSSKSQRFWQQCPRVGTFFTTTTTTTTLLLLLLLLTCASAHSNPSYTIHRRSSSPSRPSSTGPPRKRDAGVLLIVSNQCSEPLWPGVETQAGTGPGTGGFVLAPGASRRLMVGTDWAGRVWGRTNCSFGEDGVAARACVTGDCGGVLDCKGSGVAPTTLAEWDLAGGPENKSTFYDISLVDGYNLPIGITWIPGDGVLDIPPNFTNLACIATAQLMLPPTGSGTLGNVSNATYPIPYESTQSTADIAQWCPWGLQLTPPPRPGYGVFPYPVDHLPRPVFDPCLSACAASHSPADCCTGPHEGPGACKPSLYSRRAKTACPDAYSYAYDDATSTFSVPAGGGWEVTFCPTGRSTNILKTFGSLLSAVGDPGYDVKQMWVDAGNLTLIAEGGRQNGAARMRGGSASLGALVVLVAVLML